MQPIGKRLVVNTRATGNTGGPNTSLPVLKHSGEGAIVTLKNKAATSIFLGPVAVDSTGANTGYELEANEVRPFNVPPDQSLFAAAAIDGSRLDIVGWAA